MMVRLDLTNFQPTNISLPITMDVHSCDFVIEIMSRASALPATSNSVST
jgi:hypothetical protein